MRTNHRTQDLKLQQSIISCYGFLTPLTALKFSFLILLIIFSPKISSGGGCQFPVQISGDTIYCEDDPIFVVLNLTITGTGDCFCDLSLASNFQWYKNGAVIEGATTTSYIAADTGTYWLTLDFCFYFGSATTKHVSISYDNCSGISNQPAAGTLSCFPNPATQQTMVQYDLPSSQNEVELTISDMQGRVISNSKLPAPKHTFVLEVGDFAAGIYFVTLKAGESFIIKKLIKQ